MPPGPRRTLAAKCGGSCAVLVAVLVLASAFALPSLASGSAKVGSPPPVATISGPPTRTADRAHPDAPAPRPPDAVPEFSAGSVGEVTRTIFPGFNTSLPGSFTSSVATWLVGTPAYVPSTNTLWFPQRAIPVAGDPVPTVAPAAVFNLSSGEFDQLDTNVSNASALVYDPGNGYLYATEPASDSIAVVDPSNGALVHSPIPVGSSPSALCLDPNANMLFVANFESSNLTVINTQKDDVMFAGVGVGSKPASLAFDSADNVVFVASEGSKNVSVVNASNLTAPVQFIKIYYGPTFSIAYSKASGNLVATNPASDYATILNGSNQAVVTSVSVGAGFLPTATDANGSEFVLANSTGSSVVTLNSANGTILGRPISVAPGPSELVLDSATGGVFSWSSTTRILDSISLVTGEVIRSTLTTEPELEALSGSELLAKVLEASENDSTVYETTTTMPLRTGPEISVGETPISVASASFTNLTFVGTTNGLLVYNGSTGRLDTSVGDVSGHCGQLVIDDRDNFLWFLNSNSGVTAINLSTLRVVISTDLSIPASVTQGIAVDPADSEVFVVNSSNSISVLNSATGEVIASDLVVGSNLTSLVFDPADDQIYAAGDTINFIDGSTLTVDGGVAPFSAPHRVLAEAYDPSREVVYVTSVGIGIADHGTVTVIDGASVVLGEGATVAVPVGEQPEAIATVPVGGEGVSGLAEVWVANALSGTISVLSTSPTVTYFAAAPGTVDLGHAVSVHLSFSGGAGPVSISYEGLPEGCATANASEFNCTPEIAGHFDLVVNLTDALGGTATANASLVVMKALSVQVTLLPTTLPELDVGVNLVGSASASNGLPPYQYSWSFGDGVNMGGSNVSYAYSNPGAYVVTTEVQDATGAIANRSVAVVVVPRPIVNITVQPGTATDVDFPVQLFSTVTGGTGAVSETWSFGDGTEALGANVTHTWTRPGAYVVTVECTDALEVSENNSFLVYVHVSLSATFASGSISSTSPATVGSPVAFTSTGSGGTPPYSVAWSFGDGTVAYGAAVEHRYAVAGTFTVAVTLTDSVGASVQSNVTVEVTGVPPSSGSILAPSGGFATGLFLGLVLGGVVAAVVLSIAGPRKGERTPSPPTPYVPP